MATQAQPQTKSPAQLTAQAKAEPKATRTTIKIASKGVTMNLVFERDPERDGLYFVRSATAYLTPKSYVGHEFPKGAGEHFDWPSDWAKPKNKALVRAFRDAVLTLFAAIAPELKPADDDL